MTPQAHVVHVVTSDGFAGVERYVLGSALGLAATGCRVTVVGGAGAAMRASLTAAGITWLPGDNALGAARSLCRVRGDVLVSHMTHADTVAAIFGALKGVPVVSVRHFASPRGSGGFARIVGRAVGRRMRRQISISRFVAQHVDGSSEVIHTGVDSLPEAPEHMRTRSVLMLQRLEPEKAAEDGLRAWAATRDRTGWRLVIAGDGSRRRELEQLARDLGVAGEVDFLGHRDDARELLQSAGVLLAPTPREGLGISVLEAMAAGTPVVATGSGGHRETVGSVEGAAIFPPGDIAAAARELTRLIRDDSERLRYGIALRDRQRAEFTRERQAERMRDLITAVVEERSRP